MMVSLNGSMHTIGNSYVYGLLISMQSMPFEFRENSERCLCNFCVQVISGDDNADAIVHDAIIDSMQSINWR